MDNTQAAEVLRIHADIHRKMHETPVDHMTTFRPITAKTKLTFPCVMAFHHPVHEEWCAHVIEYAGDDLYYFTHWLPFQWPAVK